MSRPHNKAQHNSLTILSPLRDFLNTESAGAILLATAALVALIWANSPWSHTYDSFWESKLMISLAGQSLNLDIRHWVNDGLMTIFFFVVGLEIKRELTNGHLASRRSASLPAIAAFGGMVVPAIIYLVIAGSATPRGWAIPVATDIALAVGVLSAAGSRVPSSLRAFLLGLAIVDDIGAIIIIATVYSTGVNFGWLIASIVGVVLTFVIKSVNVRSIPTYVLIGTVVWLGLLNGGVHPTIAGVVMGLMTTASPRRHHEYVDANDLVDEVDATDTTRQSLNATVSTVEWLQHVLHPWTSFFIVPVFALANSGIHLSVGGVRDAVGSPVTWGVFFGLLVGKPMGVLIATRFAIQSGIADSPEGAGSRQVLGIGSAAGIGFTVAIFITKLALPDESDQSNAKLAILAASVMAALIASALLRTKSSR